MATLISSFPVYILFKTLYAQKLNKTTYELKNINFNYITFKDLCVEY